MSPWQLRHTAHVLRAGGVIAYPTETVYGLGCDPLDHDAVERILQLKQRPAEKGLILIAANLQQLLPYIDIQDPALLEKLEQTTQRPTTWICPLHANTPCWLSGRHDSIAVRITTSPTTKALCQNFGGAIVSTSANPTGHQPARTPLTVRRYFNQQLDYILGAERELHTQPSQIVDLISGRVIRD